MNFADLEARVDQAVISGLMDDAAYAPPGGDPVSTRAELFYRDADTGHLQSTVQSVSLPVADVPAPKRDAVIAVAGRSYRVLTEIERDASFVRVGVRPVS